MLNKSFVKITETLRMSRGLTASNPYYSIFDCLQGRRNEERITAFLYRGDPLKSHTACSLRFFSKDSMRSFAWLSLPNRR